MCTGPDSRFLHIQVETGIDIIDVSIGGKSTENKTAALLA